MVGSTPDPYSIRVAALCSAEPRFIFGVLTRKLEGNPGPQFLVEASVLEGAAAPGRHFYRFLQGVCVAPAPRRGKIRELMPFTVGKSMISKGVVVVFFFTSERYAGSQRSPPCDSVLTKWEKPDGAS